MKAEPWRGGTSWEVVVSEVLLMSVGRGFPRPWQSCAQWLTSCTSTLSPGTASSGAASERAAQPLPPRLESTISYLISSS